MTEQDEEQLLDFDRAMRDFREMFPQMSPEQIELVLRKYDGDVSATINELLFDDNTAPTSSTFFEPGESSLSTLRCRRHQINEKLRENQRLLDTVTDVESARTYEDQQLALLLEHREVSDLIKEEKIRNGQQNVRKLSERGQRRQSPPEIKKQPNSSLKNSKKCSASPEQEEELRVPDGPYVGPIGGESEKSLATKIRGTLKKASGSRISRLFSAP